MNETEGETKLGGNVLLLAQDDPAIPANSPDPTGLEDITTRALQFMSTASKETIGGIAVGLAACTYLVLGRVGLVLIGAFGGVLLHASWEGQTTLVGTVGQTRREKSLDVVKRILEWRDQETSRKTEAQLDADDHIQLDSFEGFRPETATALNNLVDAIIRDYIKWWYSPVLPQEEAFPAASRQILTKFLLSISQHLSRKRPADTFLDFLTNSSSIVIVFLNELSSALSLPQSSTASPAEAVYAYLSANPDSNLANVLNEKQQTRKFKMIADDILQNFLDKRAYECDPARIFLREILAGVVLEMTLKSCSKPEWINGWIVYLLEEGEPDISQAIDAGVVKTGGFSSAFDGFDGNIGSVDLPKAEKKKEQEVTKHQKRLGRAEDAMEEAINEAKRLSQLIAEEDKKKPQATKDAQDTASKRLADAVEKNAESLDLNTSTLFAGPQLQNSTNDVPKASEPVDSPTSPRSTSIAHSVGSSLSPRNTTSFTSFDQIVPQTVPAALQPGVSPAPKKVPSLTLHNANITIHDDSSPTDKGRIRSKPTGDYLVQIEPEPSQHPGWMIVRRYPDFETLHEVLRRIAAISGVNAFTEQHNALPNWKEHTKPSLRGELERYLRDACWYQPLAESEGMKRFLEKDSGQMPAGSSNKAGFGWPTPSAFETMGKGMLDVLTSAPKGAAEGGKVVLGGVTGVFNNIGSLGQKKMNGSSGSLTMHPAGRSSTSTLPRIDSMGSINGSRKGRASEDSLRTPPIVATQPSMIPPMERRPSYNSIAEDENDREPRASNSARSSFSGRRSTTLSREASRAPSKLTPLSTPVHNDFEEMRLPPPPSNIADDYGSPTEDSSVSHKDSSAPTTRTSTSTAPSQQSPGRQSLSIPRRESVPVTPPRKPRKEATPLTEQETRVAVELMFAVINELYTLSSAWNFRRTLLTAAKTFLLRPGNPSLSSIQSLIQDSVITANTSDAGIASHLKKLRENSLPTEEELKTWPPEMPAAEKERLRLKARKLLVERGVPAALTGVMGQAATGEAMGKIFDCLQIEEVARGLIFGLLLQGVRAVTH